ncbi:MAG: hypothetical protein Q9167_007161 [Letrouitia subvulpina]
MKVFAVLAFLDLALLGAATRMHSFSGAFTAQPTCWEGPRGGISCPSSGPNQELARRNGSKKLGSWYCWETAQGQIHCKVHKRDAFAVPYPMCLKSPGSQIHCSIPEEMTQEIQASNERTCWQADDSHVHCIVTKNGKQHIRSNKSIKKVEDDLKARGVWERLDVFHVLCFPSGYFSPYSLHKLSTVQSITWTDLLRRYAAPPWSNNPGVDPDCTKWYPVNKTSSNVCVLAMSAGDITLREFRQLNPSVNIDCTNLKINTSYCIKTDLPGPNIAIFPGPFGDETSTARPIYATTRNDKDTFITIQTPAASSVNNIDSLIASVVSKLSYMRTNDALSTAQKSPEEACYTYNLTSALSGLPIATESINYQPAYRKTFKGESRTAHLPCGRPTSSTPGTSSGSPIFRFVDGVTSTDAAPSVTEPTVPDSGERVNFDNSVYRSPPSLPQPTSQAVANEAENGHVGAPGYPLDLSAHSQ